MPQSGGIAVINALPADFTILVNIDNLTAAIENIVSNATKYTPAEGKIVVRIFLSEGNLYIETHDAGRGIPTADQDKIFTPYFRASNVGSIPGAGLGLTIAKRAVERNGGKLNFSSTTGSGSIFTISLPVKR
jgi:signal transduction histidine kinase